MFLAFLSSSLILRDDSERRGVLNEILPRKAARKNYPSEFPLVAHSFLVLRKDQGPQAWLIGAALELAPCLSSLGEWGKRIYQNTFSF